jgi:hypothetical protein
MKNVCPNQPRLKEGGVTMQINPWGKNENPREPTMVVTTKSQLWIREGVFVPM